MQRLLSLALLASATPALLAQGYSSDFESLTGSAAGTIITGQDAWYLPVAGSSDWSVYTYAGNSLGVPVNPLGGAQFLGGQSQGGSAFGRAQRPIGFTSNCYWHYTFEFCGRFTGVLPTTEYLGSFSEQPSTTNANFNLLLQWGANTTTGTMFNVATQVYDSAGVAQAIAPVPDLTFQNLPVDQWFRVEAIWDFASNMVVELKLTDLSTMTTTAYVPTGWYLFGGAAGSPIATDFRFFAGGGLGNTVAIDNFVIEPLQAYAYGSGCTGTAGVPVLSPLGNSTPTLGTAYASQITNMPGPTGVGIMVIGFSDTAFGALTLPLDLTPFGMTGCNLLASRDASALLLSASGQASWAFGIPNNPALTGIVLFNQAFVYDVGANPMGLTSSNGMRLTVL